MRKFLLNFRKNNLKNILKITTNRSTIGLFLLIKHAYDSVELGSGTEILISSSHPHTVDQGGCYREVISAADQLLRTAFLESC